MSDISHATPQDSTGELTGNASRTFYVIADDLAMWMDSLDLADTAADCAEIQAQIDRLGGDLVKKAENIAGVLTRISVEIEGESAEEMRHRKRRLAFESARDWLKAYTMRVMREHGWSKMEGRNVTLRIQKNGGQLPLDVRMEALADDFKDITVRMPLRIFAAIMEPYIPGAPETLNIKQVALEPSQERIRKALAEDCPACHGLPLEGVSLSGLPAPERECPTCHGSGKRVVPGAELEPRGEHLRIA